MNCDPTNISEGPQYAKAETCDKRSKIKGDAREKNSPFLRKKTAFLFSISLHFQLLVVSFGFKVMEYYHTHTQIKEKRFQTNRSLWPHGLG